MSAADPDFNIRYVADLARLELTEEEMATFEPQLQAILGYMKKLDEIDVDAIEPTAHANPVFNVTRPDTPRPSLTPEEALRNAPKTAKDQFIVAKVIE